MTERANSKKVLENAVVWANRPQRILDGWLGDASNGFAMQNRFDAKREMVEVTSILETPRTK